MKKNEVKMVALATVVASKTNPRGTEGTKGIAFDELVASIKEKGVLVPVLMHPKGDGYELVAGSRRMAAALAAGLEEIPAQIAEMSDQEAKEAQIIENLQRADIHPLDEAHAFEDLFRIPGMNVTEVATRIGKSETYVRQRMALCALEPKIETAVRKGDFPIAHAVVIGRLEKVQQLAAFKYSNDRYSGLSSLKELREFVSNQIFHAAMKSPPWKDNAAAKAEIARVTGLAGGEKTLFGEDAVEKIENPADYARAMAAFLQIKISEYKDAGKPLTLVSDTYRETSKGVLGRSGYSLVSDAKKCTEGRDALIVEGVGIGKVVKICTNPKCKPHHPYSYDTAKDPVERRADRKKEIAAEKRKRDKDSAAMENILKKMSWPLTEKHLDLLVGLANRYANHDVHQGLAKRRDLEVVKVKNGWTAHNYETAISKAAKGMTPKQKVGLLLELLLPGYSPNYNEGRATSLKGV